MLSTNSTAGRTTYRQTQLKKVETVYNEYNPMIKIIKPDGETNWLDITEDELQEIIKILNR